MQEQEAEPGLGDGVVVEAFFEGFLNAATDFWWFWLPFGAFIVLAKVVSDWSKRVEARANVERRAKERAKARSRAR